jgi:hypothetical protein
MIVATGLAVIATFVINVASLDQGAEDAPSPASSAGPSPEPNSLPSPELSPAPSPRQSPPPSPAPSAEREPAVTVLNAQMCRAIEKRGSPDWQCAAAAGDLQPGRYMFYTRLQTTSPTTVEHRWYDGDRMHQVMRLRVTPSPGNGYRTFSATTVSPERAGDWKVELRAADGTVLHEERFVVR